VNNFNVIIIIIIIDKAVESIMSACPILAEKIHKET
jgi:hypothetical protein